MMTNDVAECIDSILQHSIEADLCAFQGAHPLMDETVWFITLLWDDIYFIGSQRGDFN